jgi:hypothetical protein
MRVAQSAAKLIGALQGDDLVIRPMPAGGLLMPGHIDAVVTPDGIVVVDGDVALYFVTASGLVIGKAAHILRDGRAAQEAQQKQP